MSERTPGRLCISSESPKIIKACDFMGESSVIVGSASGHNNSGFFPTDEESVANARRLVAAWNACDGISTDNLENNLPVKELAHRYNAAIRERDSLRAVNAELLEALEAYEAWTDKTICTDVDLKRIREQIRAAIASARKQGEQG